MVSEFVNATAGGETTAVVKATNLTVSRSMNTITVSYVGQNVSVAGVTALTAQSSWTVQDDTAGTPETSDDTLTIDGADQGVAGASVKQVTASKVVLAPSCTQNPVSGSGVIQTSTASSSRWISSSASDLSDGGSAHYSLQITHISLK